MESFEVAVARQEARGCMIISNDSTDMLSYIFESFPLSLKCDESHGFMFTLNKKKLVELSVSVPLNVESIDKAMNK